MKYIVLFYLSIVLTTITTAQEGLADILSEPNQTNFAEIVKSCEKYFQQKHPGKSLESMFYGERRDGELVKFMRWKNFWSSRVQADGSIAILKHDQQKNEKLQRRSTGIFDDVVWENVSYENDLGFQIGLGRTSSLAFHPTDSNTFFVGTALGGIWKTKDGGNSYQPMGDDLPYLSVSCLLIDQANPDVLYAAISDRVFYGPPSIGIYKSIDGGESWNPTSLKFNFTNNVRIYWMEASPIDPQTIYVASSAGLYKTSDGFETSFRIISSGVYDVKFKPGSGDTLYYTTIRSTSLRRSTNNGESFELIQNLAPSNHARIAVSTLNPDLLLVKSANKVYRSLEAGDNLVEELTLPEQSDFDQVISISPRDEHLFYAGFFEVFKGDLNTKQTIQTTHWLGEDGLPLIHVDQRNVFTNPLQSNFIYLCNDGGVYRLNVESGVFENLSNGLVITQYYDIAVSQSNAEIISGGSQDNGNVLRSHGSWDYVAPTADGMVQAIHPTDENIFYQAIQNGKIYRYWNGNRRVISDNIPYANAEWVTPFALDMNNPSTIVVGYDGIFRSVNNGNTWQNIGPNISQGRPVDLLAIPESNPEHIYVVENFGTGTGSFFSFGHDFTNIYVKETNSNNWDLASTIRMKSVRDIVVDPSDEQHVIIAMSGYTNGQKVLESFDGGRNWENISLNLPNVPATAIFYHEGNLDNYYFVGTDVGMFYKTTNDSEWAIMGALPNTYISDIEVQKSEGLIRIATHGRGIFETNIREDIVNTNSFKEGTEDCFKVFPNPSSGELKIQTSIQSFEIEVYTIDGKNVYQTADLNLDLSHLNSGIYFLKLSTENQENTTCLQRIIIE